MMDSKTIALIGVTVCFTLLSCSDSESYTEIESSGSTLLGGFVSYVPKEILSAAAPPNSNVEVVEDYMQSPTDRLPRREFYAVTITPHNDLGHPGVLYLQFYNNRLYLSTFTPDDFLAYMSAFEKTRGRLAGKGDRFRSGNTEYWRGVNYRTNLPFVGAMDIRLAAQNSRWEARYASFLLESTMASNAVMFGNALDSTKNCSRAMAVHGASSPVGWVEQRDTHRLPFRLLGIAALHPTYIH